MRLLFVALLAACGSATKPPARPAPDPMRSPNTSRSEGQYELPPQDQDATIARQQAIEQARAAGILGESSDVAKAQQALGDGWTCQPKNPDVIMCFRASQVPTHDD